MSIDDEYTYPDGGGFTVGVPSASIPAVCVLATPLVAVIHRRSWIKN
jgi:hypothetical protein